MELTSFELNGLCYKLTKSDRQSENNKFTLLIGENGSGKSEVIREIINILLRMQIPDKYNRKYTDILDNYLENNYKSTLRDYNISTVAEFRFNNDKILVSSNKTNEARKIINFKGEEVFLIDDSYRYDFKINTRIPHDELSNHIASLNIIAASESQYIKFPIIQSDEILNYHYLGKKQEKDYLYMNYRSDDYINPIVKNLSKHIFNTINNNKENNIEHILDFLSLNKEISITFKIKSNYIHRLKDKETLLEQLLTSPNRFSSLGIINNNTINVSNERNRLEKAINFLESKLNLDLDNTFDSDFSSEDKEIKFNILSKENYDIYKSKQITTLLKYDLINIIKLNFYNNKDHEINATQLSSGQLCILSVFLGIASKISNNSFIFIDEPEISLHPSWQVGFIKLLEKTFINYKNCHFIIATHSPHIISNINKENSYIVIMDEDHSFINKGGEGYQGWTIDEVLQDAMGMDETRSELYKSLIKSFNTALDEDDSIQAKIIFEELKKILHPDNILKKVLEIQMIGVGEND